MPALTSGKYHLKWTRLADLPVPMHNACVAVQHHKIYVTGSSPVENAEHLIHVYDINIDQWNQLPPSGHYYGIPHIIGGKLAVIGGRLSATKKMTNKVSTFDEVTQSWTSYYPDLLSVRNKPGVVSHLGYVIVVGGIGIHPRTKDIDSPEYIVQNDIEVLNWIEKSHWIKISINFPDRMWALTPIISDDHLVIVGYCGADMKTYKDAYKIPIANITASVDQNYNTDMPTKWTKLTAADHWCTALVPSSSPLVVVGGRSKITKGSRPTSDIKMYDYSNKSSWKKIGSLSSARSMVAVATVYDNAVVTIGGCTEGGTIENAKSSSLTVVELGQAELLH